MLFLVTLCYERTLRNLFERKMKSLLSFLLFAPVIDILKKINRTETTKDFFYKGLLRFLTLVLVGYYSMLKTRIRN